jgi:putative flippase GtrA
MVVLIPSYEPDHKLVTLIAAIRADDPAVPIVIVDDGSGPAYAAIFAAARESRCDVVTHSRNRGKGAALKTGFAHVAARYPQHDVVCADCDGQHTVTDIARVGAATHERRDGIVLGARGFDGDVPLRSRFGNTVTRTLFGWLTGTHLGDTQTGLRGYPAYLLGWLQDVPGDRFEYELEVLLAARRLGLAIHELPIGTIYLDGNASSHFDPIRDSIRVYVPLVKFATASLTAFAVDAAVFFALLALGAPLLWSVVLARVTSAAFNFSANRRFVFGDRRGGPWRAVRYALVALVILALNATLLAVLIGHLSVPVVPAKLGTESALWLVSFAAQRRWVFADPTSTDPTALETTGRATREPARSGRATRAHSIGDGL